MAAAQRKLDQAGALRQLEAAADAARRGDGGDAGDDASLRIDATHRLLAETQASVHMVIHANTFLLLRGGRDRGPAAEAAPLKACNGGRGATIDVGAPNCLA